MSHKHKEVEVDPEYLGKDGSDMETDDTDRVESWKDEEVGEEEGGEEEDFDQKILIKETSRMDSGNEMENQEEDEGNKEEITHSVSLGDLNNQPMEEPDNQKKLGGQGNGNKAEQG